MLFFKQCPVSYNTPYEKIGDEVRSLTDKVPFDIPDSWEWVRLGTVIELESGQDLTPDKYNDCGKGIPYITGASNIENGNVLINRWTEYGRAFAYCGDVLLTCKGTVGTMAVLQEPQVHIARQIMAIRPISELYVPYIQLVLETLVENLKAAAKSMIPGIAREDVLQSLFPVPPVSEQKRIVHKVSELSPCLEQYAAADTKLLSLNTGFPEALKKSILQEAVQGKLVPQDPTDEPAEALLERIRAKKQQLIKEGKIKKDKHESVIFRRDNSHYEKLDGMERCIDDELPFEIPESWAWVRWGAIAESIQYGYNAPAKQEGRIRMVRISDIHENTVAWSSVPFCDIDDSDIPTYLLQANDILFARTGGTVGKSFLVSEVPCESIYAGYLIRTRYSSLLCPQYLKYFMESPLYWQQLKSGTTATAQPNCNGQTLAKMLLPLPPANEQLRIVDNLTRTFAIIERM